MKVKVACTETTTTYYVVVVADLAEAEMICKAVNDGECDVDDFEFDSQGNAEQGDFRVIEKLPDNGV